MKLLYHTNYKTISIDGTQILHTQLSSTQRKKTFISTLELRIDICLFLYLIYMDAHGFFYITFCFTIHPDAYKYTLDHKLTILLLMDILNAFNFLAKTKYYTFKALNKAKYKDNHNEVVS